MRKDLQWNDILTCWEAKAKIDPYINVPLQVCTIVISEMGYFYLYCKDHRIKELSLEQFLEYRSLVNGVIGEEYLV